MSYDAYLVSMRRIRNGDGTTWRDAGTYDPRSATVSRTLNGTRSYVDICDRAIQQQCGDETLDTSSGEQCDDGNTVGGDGCNGACFIESCGNGFIEEMNGEECDDENTNNGDGCTSTCTLEYCGDGIVQAGLDEQCDDGNGDTGDGCSMSCETESSSSSSESSSSEYSSWSSSF
jgi:cysteine-rich repeat protein